MLCVYVPYAYRSIQLPFTSNNILNVKIHIWISLWFMHCMDLVGSRYIIQLHMLLYSDE